jgi:PAS domain S-box-containing protein
MTQDEFRWQALFQRAREPLFLLNRQRRILFVNRAWEELTGVSAAEARGRRVGHRRKPATLPLDEALAHALTPPLEVLQGRPARARRLAPGGARLGWWDVEFFPLRGDDGLLAIVGKVHAVTADADPARPSGPLPEKLVALREGLRQRYNLELFDSELPAVRRVAEQIRLAMKTRVPVLIVGAPGTGKYTVARTLHHSAPTDVESAPAEQAFAALDCGLPLAALEETLFAPHGLTRRPEIGTIYLKEPGRLPRELQARLVELLDESSEPAAGAPPRPRWVAGCLCDPAEDVRAGRLLEDLHCRLGTVVITLPSLQERRGDLFALTERLLRRARSDGDGVAHRPTSLTGEAWEVLEHYPWPGNLRELYTVLTGAAQRATGAHIEAADLPAYVRLAVRLDALPPPPPERALPLDELLQEAERRLIALALRLARGNRSRAAEILAVWRPRLQRRMEALGLDQ